MAIVGLLLASAAVVAAIIWEFPYWYTPFTIGSFLFFDRLSERFGARSLLALLRGGHWRVGFWMYLAAALIALVVDVLYGRTLGRAWVYPPWHGIANIAVPVFFHYPFGFLSLYATFQAVRGLLAIGGSYSLDHRPPVREFGDREPAERISRDFPRGAELHGFTDVLVDLGKVSRRGSVEFPGTWYGRISFVALGLSLALPPFNYWLNADRSASELLLVVMVISTVAVDGVRQALTGDSILRELVMRRWRFAAAIVVTLAWAIVINEGPNVFAREWVYLSSPFGLPLWAMLILGWPFLLVVSAAVYETTLASA